MLTDLVNRLRILPRWVIIAIDLAVCVLSTFLAFLFRFNFDISEAGRFPVGLGILVFVLAGFASSLITRSYAGVVRYTGIDDGIRIMYTSLLTLVLTCILNLIYYYNVSKNLIPYSVAFISFFITFLTLFFYRLLVKSLFQYYKSKRDEYTNVLIYGAGQLGITAKQAMENDSHHRLHLIGFVEEDPSKIGKVINGAAVYGVDELPGLISLHGVKELIIAIRDLSLEKRGALLDLGLKHHVKVKYVPPVNRWAHGELSLNQIKDVKIEDLLGRDVITIDNPEVVEETRGRVIMVTGAAGSIGSELCRQLYRLRPKLLVLVDQAETPLFEIEMELARQGRSVELVACVCDVTNRQRLDKVMADTRPELVYHAAAYKHVPMMEANPVEAIHCNVLGTRLLADLSVAHGVRKFVMISTDKAVNPTSVMGCSKRIAEMYVQSLSHRPGVSTVFVTTRFGNVLGSNGSVIPIFRRQIEEGGPITVTHPEIVRYFMTIPEACRLVLEAGVMGRGGEIFIFDMGEPVRIFDLAKRMVQLSGLQVGKDIDIVFTGLREGEKLFEELLTDAENTVPTHHPKILKARVAEHDLVRISEFLDLIEEMMADRNELKLVAIMKDIVPEYKSAVSRFQVLD